MASSDLGSRFYNGRAESFFVAREWVFLYSNKSDISSPPLYTQHFTLQDHLVMDEEVDEEADKEVKEVTNGVGTFLYSNKPDIHLTLQDLNSHNIDKSASEIIQKNFNIDEPKPNLQS